MKSNLVRNAASDLIRASQLSAFWLLTWVAFSLGTWYFITVHHKGVPSLNHHYDVVSGSFLFARREQRRIRRDPPDRQRRPVHVFHLCHHIRSHGGACGWSLRHAGHSKFLKLLISLLKSIQTPFEMVFGGIIGFAVVLHTVRGMLSLNFHIYLLLRSPFST